jgi:hypothetical protein
MTAKQRQVCRNVTAGTLASLPVLMPSKKGSVRKGAIPRALRNGRFGALLGSSAAGWWIASTGTKEKDVVEATVMVGAVGGLAGFAGGAVASLVYDAIRP